MRDTAACILGAVDWRSASIDAIRKVALSLKPSFDALPVGEADRTPQEIFQTVHRSCPQVANELCVAWGLEEYAASLAAFKQRTESMLTTDDVSCTMSDARCTLYDAGCTLYDARCGSARDIGYDTL